MVNAQSPGSNLITSLYMYEARSLTVTLWIPTLNVRGPMGHWGCSTFEAPIRRLFDTDSEIATEFNHPHPFPLTPRLTVKRHFV